MCISINVAKEVYMSQKYYLKNKSQALLPHRDAKIQYMDWYPYENCINHVRRCCFQGVWKAKSKHTETYEESFNSTLANPLNHPLPKSGTAQCHQERSLLMAAPWQEGREEGRVCNVLIFGRLPEELVLVCLMWSSGELSIIWIIGGHWKQGEVVLEGLQC